MKKKSFTGDGGAHGMDGWACRRQTHLLEEAHVKTVSHAPPAPDRRSVRVGVWEVIFQRGFHHKVDQREALLLVCSSAGIEVIEKSRR